MIPSESLFPVPLGAALAWRRLFVLSLFPGDPLFIHSPSPPEAGPPTLVGGLQATHAPGRGQKVYRVAPGVVSVRTGARWRAISAAECRKKQQCPDSRIESGAV